MNTVTCVIVLFLGHFVEGNGKTEIYWTKTGRKYSLSVILGKIPITNSILFFILHSSVLKLGQ